MPCRNAGGSWNRIPKKVIPSEGSTKRNPNSAKQSNAHAIGLGEGRLVVGQGGIAKSLVSPSGPPAVPDDEAVGGVTHEGDGMASPGCIGLINV